MGDDWTLYTATLSEMSGPRFCRIAIRYFVLDAGPGAPNSSFIGIDDFRIQREVIGMEERVAAERSAFPNPTDGPLQLPADASTPGAFVRVLASDGREAGRFAPEDGRIDLGELPPAVYTLLVMRPGSAHLALRVIKQ